MPCRSTHSRVRLRTLTCSLSPMPPTRAVYAALAKFRAPLEGLTAEDFIERDRFFRMGRAPVMVDILPEISGVDFDRVYGKDGLRPSSTRKAASPCLSFQAKT